MFHRFHADRLADRARDLYGESREFARHSTDQANIFIHARPVTATLIAVAAGLVIGFVYPRRPEKGPVARLPRRPQASSKTRKRSRD